jgi:hypothetical protein
LFVIDKLKSTTCRNTRQGRRRTKIMREFSRFRRSCSKRRTKKKRHKSRKRIRSWLDIISRSCRRTSKTVMLQLRKI